MLHDEQIGEDPDQRPSRLHGEPLSFAMEYEFTTMQIKVDSRNVGVSLSSHPWLYPIYWNVWALGATNASST